MPTLRLQRDMPFPRQAVFDVIADVARYPAFMPGFKAVETLGRDGDTLFVRQTVGAGGLTNTFLSRATFSEPERIDIVSEDAPFRRLQQSWRFEARGDHRTRVHLDADYTLADRLTGVVFNRVFPGLLRNGLTAVGRRVAEVSRRGGTGRRDTAPRPRPPTS